MLARAVGVLVSAACFEVINDTLPDVHVVSDALVKRTSFWAVVQTEAVAPGAPAAAGADAADVVVAGVVVVPAVV